MDGEAFLERLRSSRHYRGQIGHVARLPARPARTALLTPPLADPLPTVLERQGVAALYQHQVTAIQQSRAGRDLVVVTGTASGKTFCYNLPVLEALLAEPRARALYLFPTKALAQDQWKGLRRLMEAEPRLASIKGGVYDGDTPAATRKKLRDEARILLTNPDMLHSGILPYHTRWARFLAHLHTVVVDEVHAYRGIFGSNVANVLRRLTRLAGHYGAQPRFTCCSATIANPVELAEGLTGRPMTLVENDGAPRAEKLFVFWNPPLRGEGERASANVEAQHLMAGLIREGVATIAFGRARIVAELLYRYVREELQRDGPRMANAVRAYRGGYLAAERREIEQQLFRGELLGVTSTNALELGVDIGGLDAAILIGFPGTVASFWQQAGRAGRSFGSHRRGAEDAEGRHAEKSTPAGQKSVLCDLCASSEAGGEESPPSQTSPASLVFFVGYDDPIDQFIMRQPEYVLERSPERAVVDPENPYLLAGHLKCAAAELPLRAEDARFFGDRALDVAQALADEGLLRAMSGAFYWAQPEQPAHRVNLRTTSDNTFTIVETTDQNRVIGEVDAISAPELVYPEAVYLHEAQTYFVESLDLVNKVAYVRRAEMDYYTQAILESLIRVNEEERRRDWRGSALVYGSVTVTWSTVAFKKIQFYSTDSLGWGKVDLPPQHLETMGIWLTPSEAAQARVRAAGRNPVEGLVGLRNSAVHLLPLYAMCDKQDIGGIVDSANTGAPTLFLYDRYRGGLGFAEKGYELIEELMRACLQLIRACRCRDGCPSCVGVPILRPPIHTDPDAGGGFPIPDKEAAVRLLEAMLEAAPSVEVGGVEGSVRL
jgi:DEAD/DEAH box helicase domain-containing protein